jgi:hypothetical protein
MWNCNLNKFLPAVFFLTAVSMLSGCAPMQPTHYILNSNPQGAKIYRGTSPNSLNYYQTTPYSDLTQNLKGWTGNYFQARKEGYNDSTVVRQPWMAAGGRVPIHFNLQKKEDALAAYRQRNTLPGYYEYLRKYPLSNNMNAAFKLMMPLIELSNSPKAGYKRLVDQYPSAAMLLPEGVRLDYIGPGGMKITDLRGLLKQGIGSAILQQKIISAGEPYAEFSFAEIRRLTKMGFSDQLIASMLKVTQDHKVKQEQQEKEQAAAVAARKQQQRAVSRTSTPAVRNQGSAVGDKLKDCVVMLAKKKACDQIGGFGGMACMALLPGGHNCF